LIPFGIAIVVYVVFYYGIEHRRTKNGPWRVTFTNDVSGHPVLLVEQPTLAITNLQISFIDETNRNSQSNAWNFAQPQPVPYEVPFGKCLFMDTTFLPGTLAFDLLGHQIQLIPRVLTIDGKELTWGANEWFIVSKTNVQGPFEIKK
jgi:hypothetical protein